MEQATEHAHLWWVHTPNGGTMPPETIAARLRNSTPSGESETSFIKWHTLHTPDRFRAS